MFEMVTTNACGSCELVMVPVKNVRPDSSLCVLVKVACNLCVHIFTKVKSLLRENNI